MNNVNLLGVYDTDSVRGKKIATIYDTKYFEKANELMQKCDAISIVTPTEFHYDVAKAAISNFDCNVTGYISGTVLYSTAGKEVDTTTSCL